MIKIKILKIFIQHIYVLQAFKGKFCQVNFMKQAIYKLSISIDSIETCKKLTNFNKRHHEPYLK